MKYEMFCISMQGQIKGNKLSIHFHFFLIEQGLLSAVEIMHGVKHHRFWVLFFSAFELTVIFDSNLVNARQVVKNATVDIQQLKAKRRAFLVTCCGLQSCTKVDGDASIRNRQSTLPPEYGAKDQGEGNLLPETGGEGGDESRMDLDVTGSEDEVSIPPGEDIVRYPVGTISPAEEAAAQKIESIPWEKRVKGPDVVGNCDANKKTSFKYDVAGKYGECDDLANGAFTGKVDNIAACSPCYNYKISNNYNPYNSTYNPYNSTYNYNCSKHGRNYNRSYNNNYKSNYGYNSSYDYHNTIYDDYITNYNNHLTHYDDYITNYNNHFTHYDDYITNYDNHIIHYNYNTII
ncbi:hypothetical protein B566_EDAN015254 [Ephemera danica]|nr:hypothetical protein B566_EDAN015254 [Ephemera danica]